MEGTNKQKSEALTSSLVKLQSRLIAKKYGRLGALFIRAISVKELSVERLLVLQPALIVLSQWVKISNACSQLFLIIQYRLRSSFRHTLLYEIILFMMQGICLYGFIAIGVGIFNLEVDLVFFALIFVLLICSTVYLLFLRAFIRFGYLWICCCLWIYVLWYVFHWGAIHGNSSP
ncbi:hypothetical protein N9X41_04745 [Porticoccaceae bacterium]|nr:hypothetical protein [Porticoccaceae bacterium]